MAHLPISFAGLLLPQPQLTFQRDTPSLEGHNLSALETQQSQPILGPASSSSPSAPPHRAPSGAKPPGKRSLWVLSCGQPQVRRTSVYQERATSRTWPTFPWELYPHHWQGPQVPTLCTHKWPSKGHGILQQGETSVRGSRAQCS